MTCKSFEGRQTGEAIGIATDAMIRDISSIRPGTSKVMITDAASNMGKRMRHSHEVDYHLLCLDHIINNCVIHALGIKEVEPLVKKVKEMASKTHRSYINNKKIIPSSTVNREGRSKIK